MLAPTALWFLPLKQVKQRSHRQQSPENLPVPFIFSFSLQQTSPHSFMRMCSPAYRFSNICETCTHKGTGIYTRGGLNTLHMFSTSLVWHLQEHGNLCDWKTRLWLWSGFVTFCSEMSTNYTATEQSAAGGAATVLFWKCVISCCCLPILVQTDVFLKMLTAAHEPCDRVDVSVGATAPTMPLESSGSQWGQWAVSLYSAERDGVWTLSQRIMSAMQTLFFTYFMFLGKALN